MLWPAPILIVIAAVLVFFGRRTVNGSGPADQRLGGAFLYFAAIVALILAVLWWIGVVTWKAFW